MRFFTGSLAIVVTAALTGCRPSTTTVIVDPAPPTTTVTQPPEAEPDAPAPPPTEEAALAGLAPAELVERLASDQDRDAATRVLVRRGAEAIPALLPALKHERWQVRAAVAFTLGQLKDQGQPAVAQLKSLAASDSEPAVRDAASFALDAIQGN